MCKRRNCRKAKFWIGLPNRSSTFCSCRKYPIGRGQRGRRFEFLKDRGKGDSGILLKADLARGVTAEEGGEGWYAVLVWNTALISLHLPHSGKQGNRQATTVLGGVDPSGSVGDSGRGSLGANILDEEDCDPYVKCLDEILSCLDNWKGCSTAPSEFTIMIGADTNTTLEQKLDQLTGPLIYFNERNQTQALHFALQNFLVMLDLRASNTFLQERFSPMGLPTPLASRGLAPSSSSSSSALPTLGLWTWHQCRGELLTAQQKGAAKRRRSRGLAPVAREERRSQLYFIFLQPKLGGHLGTDRGDRVQDGGSSRPSSGGGAIPVSFRHQLDFSDGGIFVDRMGSGKPREGSRIFQGVPGGDCEKTGPRRILFGEHREKIVRGGVQLCRHDHGTTEVAGSAQTKHGGPQSAGKVDDGGGRSRASGSSQGGPSGETKKAAPKLGIKSAKYHCSCLPSGPGPNVSSWTRGLAHCGTCRLAGGGGALSGGKNRTP